MCCSGVFLFVSYRGVILYGDRVSCVLLWSAFHDHVRCLNVVVSCCVVVVLSCSLLVVVVMSWSSCWCRVTRCLSRESIRQDIFIDQEQETYDIKVPSWS